MVIKSLKIKNQLYYYWNDIIFIDDFNIKFLKINKRESKIGVSIKPLYLIIKSLLGSVEKIDRLSDRYIVVDKSNIEVINVFNTL